MPDVGLSFSPTQAPNQYGQGQGGRSGPSNPVMDAIKILSFRVPQILGPGSPVAPGLLAGQGGATPGLGGNDAALIQQWIQRFFGQGVNQGGAMAPPDAPAPQGSGFGGFGGFGGAPQAPQAPSEPGRPTFELPAAPINRDTRTSNLMDAINMDQQSRQTGSPTAFTNTAAPFSNPNAFTGSGGGFIPNR